MKKELRFYSYILCILCVLIVVSRAAQAEQGLVEIDKIKDLVSFHEELPEEEFVDGSDLYEEEPLGDRFLAYSIRLPKGWSKAHESLTATYNEEEITKAGVSQRILGLVAKYYGHRAH